jgi:putative acetyltransferase
MSAFRLREGRKSDLQALCALRDRSIRTLAKVVYTDEQIEVWARKAADLGGTARLFDGRLVILAVSESDEPLAFADLEADGHVDFLYAAPEAAGTGAAGAVMDRIEDEAKARGLARLYTEASERARPFLERRGFAVTARRDLRLDGVAIHNYAMEKALP